jgi:N-acetylglutamate synthase-like GNAT family acetyltransferase
MIRKLEQSDASGLLKFFIKLVTADPERVERLEDVQSFTVPDEERWIASRLEGEKESQIFARVIEESGEIVGEGEVERLKRWIERHVAEIRFGVLPEHASRALELVQELEGVAKAAGIEVLYYFHLSTQAKGLEVMRQAGFKDAGKIEAFYKRQGQYIDRVYLAKDLRG